MRSLKSALFALIALQLCVCNGYLRASFPSKIVKKDYKTRPIVFATEDNIPSKTENLKGPYLALWGSFVLYAFALSPGGSPEAGAVDSSLIAEIISTPFDGQITPIFVALFNSLGIIPAIYASLLLPGAKEQKVPALPFVASSFALGFFGLGPYLGLRERQIAPTEYGRGTRLFEFKGTSLSLFAFACYLLYYATAGAFDGDRMQAYLDLFQSQRLVHVSTVDFTILSLAMWEPMSEDMQRRGWSGPPATAVCALPVIGPALYLLLRPELPKPVEE